MPLETPSITSPPISDGPDASALPSDTDPSPSSVIDDGDNTASIPDVTASAVTSDGAVEATAVTDANSAAASDSVIADSTAASEAASPTASDLDTVSSAAATDSGFPAASNSEAESTAAPTEASVSAESSSDQVSSTPNTVLQTSATIAPTSLRPATSKSPQVPKKPSVTNKANKPTPTTKPQPKPTSNDFVTYIRQVFNLARQHGGKNPNQLVMEWLRHEEYDNLQWSQLVSSIDQKFIQQVNNSGIQPIRTLKDPGTGIDFKVSHLGACMNGVFVVGQASQGATNRPDVAGWGGDLITFYGDWQLAVQGGARRGGGGRRRSLSSHRNENLQERATPLSGGDYARQHMATRTDDNTFKLRDMIEDADCYNIASRLRANPNLSIADEVQANLASGYKTRMQRFFNGRFGSASAAQAIMKDMLVPGNDMLVNVGRTKLIWDVAGLGTTLPFRLKAQDLNDFTKGVVDRLQALVVAEAKGTL